MPFVPNSTLPFNEHWSRIRIPYYNPRVHPLAIPAVRWDECPKRFLCVNEKWASHILGVLDLLDQWDTWKGTNDEIDDARQQVNQIIECFVGGDVNCCCNENVVTNSRITSEGELQVSYDGGETWVQDPNDPRLTLPILPPPTGGSVSEIRCKFAQSVTESIRQQQEVLSADTAQWSSISALMAALVVLLIAIGIIGSGGALTPYLLGLAAALLTVGKDAFDAAMTPAVYNQLQCIIYCNTLDDGTMDGNGLTSVKRQIESSLVGIAPKFLVGVLNTWGVQGVNQAGHAGLITDNDCSDCDCSCIRNFVVWEGQGSNISYGQDPDGKEWVQITTVQNDTYWGGDKFGWALTTNDPNTCCAIDNMLVIAGSRTGGVTLFNRCGNPIPIFGSVAFTDTGFPPAGDIEVNSIGQNSDTAFTVRVYPTVAP